MHLAILGNISLQSVSWHVAFYQTALKSSLLVKDDWFSHIGFFSFIHRNSEVICNLIDITQFSILGPKILKQSDSWGILQTYQQSILLLREVRKSIEGGQAGEWASCVFFPWFIILQKLVLYWDNVEEMVSWPSEPQRWRFVTEAKGTVITIRKSFALVGQKNWGIDKLSVPILSYFLLGELCPNERKKGAVSAV